MCERLLNLQEIYVSGQNICIEVYGNSVGTITPIEIHNDIFFFFFFTYDHYHRLRIDGPLSLKAKENIKKSKSD